MSIDYAKIVPIPKPNEMNSEYHPPTSRQMLGKFGVPGEPNPDCGEVTNRRLAARIVTRWVGPFEVTGFDVVVEALHQAFIELRDVAGEGDLFEQVSTAGMLCVRKKRGSDDWSNHSWGTTVDLGIGGSVVDQGKRVCYTGMLKFYPILHKHGFYWAAGYSGRSVDSMHWDYAWEKVREIEF